MPVWYLLRPSLMWLRSSCRLLILQVSLTVQSRATAVGQHIRLTCPRIAAAWLHPGLHICWHTKGARYAASLTVTQHGSIKETVRRVHLCSLPALYARSTAGPP